MDAKRREAYLSLVDLLLRCRSGDEPNILEAHQALMDDDFIKILEQQAEFYTQQGDQNTASFLNYVAFKVKEWSQFQNLTSMKNHEAYVNLIDILIGCPNGEETKILEAHEHLLDDEFLETLTWTIKQSVKSGDRKIADFLQHIVNAVRGWQRNQIHVKLIHQLLQHPEQKQEILATHSNLLDADFVDALGHSASQIADQGDQFFARFLLGIAQDLAPKFGGLSDWSKQKLEANRLLLEQNTEQVQRGQFEAALKSSQNALKIYQAINDRWGEGEASGAVGNAFFFLGRYEQATKFHEQHLAIAQEIQNRQGEMSAYGNLGNIYAGCGNFQEALKYYQQQLDVARELENQMGLMNGLGSLANVYYSLGKLDNAIQVSEECLEIAKKLQDRRVQAVAYGSLGISYYGVADYERAKTFLEKQYEISCEIKDSFQEANALANLGAVFFSKEEFDAAIKKLDRALALYRQIHNLLGEASALGNLGHAYSALRNHPKAIWCYEKCLVLAKLLKHHQLEGQVLGGLGITFLSSKNYRDAIKYSRQNIKAARRSQDLASEANALNNLGIALHASGNLSEAEQSLRDGISVFESLRQQLSNRDAEKISIFERQMRCYTSLQDVLVTQDKIEEALEIAERGRTRAFIDLLRERIGSQIVEQNVIQRIVDESLTVQQIKQFAKEQKVTLVEYSVLHDYGIIDTPAKAMRFTYGLKLFIWVVRPTGEVNFEQVDFTSHIDLLDSSLKNLVLDLHRSIGVLENNQTEDGNSKQPRDGRDTCQELKNLHNLLIQPISTFLPSEPDSLVIFIPQDNLFLVPFSALQDPDSQKFLIEQHTILTTPSIQVLKLTKEHGMDISKSTLQALVVGNPKMPTIPLTDPPVKLQDLAWAKTEANAIAHLLNTQAITGADATKAYITQKMPKARLIHLATHGLLDDIRQLGIPGAVALAPSGDDHGFLTADEIYDMSLQAELVVLSACSTGQGKITGDGVVGLSRCLIAAGVRSVIVSLWSVDDLSTTLLMVKFYEIFQRGVAPAIALNESQRWLMGINKTKLAAWVEANEAFFDDTLKINLHRRLNQLEDDEKPFDNPRYWAAFCAIGQ